MTEPQFVGGVREFWSGVGEHISEAFIRGYAELMRPLNRGVASDLENIAEHSNRLAAENRELHERAMSPEEARLRYFVKHWPSEE